MNYQLLLALLLAQQPQTTITPSGSSTVRPGETIHFALLLEPSTPIAGIQWHLQIPNALGSVSSAMVGTAAQALEKQLYCTADSRSCVVVGMNDRAFSSGELAEYTITIPQNTPSGVYTISLAGLLAASASGTPVPITMRVPYTLRVLSMADIDADGAITVEDFRRILDQVLGRAACTNDQTGDGKCDVLDVLVVVRESLAAVP